MDSSKTPSKWKQLKSVRTTAPALFYAVLFLVCIELLAIFVGPLVIPQSVYLGWYLSSDSKREFREFLRNQDEFMIYDAVTGWRNRPNASRGMWQLDSLGSRTGHPFKLESAKQNRVLFLGSSLINGGTAVGNEETVSALMEDSLFECLNFATMLYALDQSYLAYERRLNNLNANIVVVGLSESPHLGVQNQYIPFRSPDETNMPYMKPRFLSDGDQLKLLPIASQENLLASLDDYSKFERLVNNDKFLSNFREYQRFALTPLARLVWTGVKRGRSLFGANNPNVQELTFLTNIMQTFVTNVNSNGAKLIFVIFPEKVTISGSIKARVQNKSESYDNFVKSLDDQFHIVDAKAVFEQSGLPLDQLYYADGIHLSADGNRLLATAIKQIAIELLSE